MPDSNSQTNRQHPLAPTKHHSLRRALWHDYREPGVYLITLVTEGRRPWLGSLSDAGGIHVDLSPLGRAIADEEINVINQVYPMVSVWQTCLMPDHIHMIVKVKDWLPEGKHLGKIINGFKTGCRKAMRRIVPTEGGGLFEKGYNDKILLGYGTLDKWRHYLDDNPRRLYLKQKHKDLFIVKHDINLYGLNCAMVGNLFLLDYPDKDAVIVHRRDSDADFQRKKAEWLACGERGGVLVSAAIAPREKIVLREARDAGYRIILLRENGFPPLYKPAGEAFDACCRGELLQISPWEFHLEKRMIARRQCLALNDLASKLASRGAEA